ncbi:MAG TPA: hypothetical protein ENK02_10515 [Planctomycetes bacterium]|nr:hypothetical protein [Planctomycetota bacterium]
MVFRTLILLAFVPVGTSLPSPGLPSQGFPSQGRKEQDKLPLLVLEKDDTVVTRSCVIRIPAGKVIADRNGDGVLQIRGKGLRIRFEPGSVLRGAAKGTPWDRLQGIGLRAEGAPGLRLSGLKVHGYKVGLFLKDCDDLLVEELDASDNFRQRLGSTPEREDAMDWLFPHRNDEGQWRQKWGAALYLERCERPVVRRVRVRRGQNGIILDRVRGAKVYDNDCSFLSGWGLALWRSSDNVITRNAFDFCVRGYSHGVYNRGQDSAGILMFEQCQRNYFAENSVTHGGDGFFGLSGREALGQSKPPRKGWSYKGRGNRENVFVRNDFSYAAGHGFEETFAFDEILSKNRIVGNAITGLWGGYSQGMLILDNLFEANGERGYGLERGAINIEHGKNITILRNRFVKNRCGVHLWWDRDEELHKLPWFQANPEEGGETWIVGNRFEGDEVALHLRGGVKGVHFVGNKLVGVKKELLLEGGSEVDRKTVKKGLMGLSLDPNRRVLGETRPVGARKHLRGRENILMGPWGPWDHASPFLRARGQNAQGMSWDLLGVTEKPRVLQARGIASGLRIEPIPGVGFHLSLGAEGRGFFPFSFVLEGEGYRFPVRGSLLATEWKVRVFSWQTDPRKDEKAWRKEAEEKGFEVRLPSLRLLYGMGGPASLDLSPEIRKGLPQTDQFGTIASTELRLPAGTWLVQTTSDDGIRVQVDGKTLIEDWTWHGPTRHDAKLVLKKEKTLRFLVEHFELNGYALLKLELKRAQ